MSVQSVASSQTSHYSPLRLIVRVRRNRGKDVAVGGEESERRLRNSVRIMLSVGV